MSELLSPAQAITPENDPTAAAYARDLAGFPDPHAEWHRLELDAATYGPGRPPAPDPDQDPADLPGTCTTDQHSQISALLLERNPVLTAEIISDFVSEVLGTRFGPGDHLWALSGRQAATLLLALEAQRSTFGKHHHTGRHRTPCR